MSSVDKVIDWENFIEENCGFDESVIDWKTLNGEYEKETDEERKQIIDLILWKSDHVDSLLNAKKTYIKYKDSEDINKAFEYIFKKLSQQVKYIPEAQAVMQKINEQVMLAYERVLECCLIRDKKGLEELQKMLTDYDEAHS